MAENQEVIAANGEAEANGERPEDKSFHERLNEIPVYTMTLNQLCSIYSSLKERNDVLKRAFSAGEYYAKAIADTAKPVVACATTSAFAAAKPVIGEVHDPGLLICFGVPIHSKTNATFFSRALFAIYVIGKRHEKMFLYCLFSTDFHLEIFSF